MMHALIVSIQMVLVGFVLHMVGGVYVAMLLAWTLLKLEDGASNMATRSLLAVWMDAVIRAFCVDFAKDMEPTVGRRGTNWAQSPPDLDWYLDILQKHTTVDSAPRCLSR
jgi:hypothetical protein